ncbi:hypothetical protein [Collimonas humicola]|uniref:hypothetical protein n=1 Tax=Collimonas humicola TaxID=2825886 RepID=UPI001B8B76B0|nr:hypothetical protein [Collimonas humicola]
MASMLAIGKRWRAQVRIKVRSREIGARYRIDVESGNPSVLKTDLATLIADYQTVREKSARPAAPMSNEHCMMKRLIPKPGDKVAAELTAQDIVNYAQARRTEDGVGGYSQEEYQALGDCFHRPIRVPRLSMVTSSSPPSPVDRSWYAADLLLYVINIGSPT